MTIYEKVAALHNISPEEVEKEMRLALEVAHIQTEPESFINLAAAVVKRAAV